MASRYDVLTEQRGDDVQGGSSEGYKRPIGLALGVLFASILVACGGSGSNQTAGSTTPATSQPPTTQSTPEEGDASPGVTATPDEARKKIQHVVVIMQENRSFDHYFGTYPGADGIPMQDSVPRVCVPDATTDQCVEPFHDSKDRDIGGPHRAADAASDIDGGKMDGFVRQALEGTKRQCEDQFDPACGGSEEGPNVMGYHDAREIPNYWTYAEQFVLQDRMFEPNASWSLPAHLFTVSGWSAKCSEPGDPMSCQNELQDTDRPVEKRNKKSKSNSKAAKEPDYAWTDLTYLLHENDVSWAYYLDQGTQPDCDDDEMFCTQKPQRTNVPEIWNPLRYPTSTP